MACGILVPQPGIEPRPLAVKVKSPNHWTAREFPQLGNLIPCARNLGNTAVSQGISEIKTILMSFSPHLFLTHSLIPPLRLSDIY